MDATAVPALLDQPATPSSHDRSEQLACEITELSAWIYAATFRLLELIREFDVERHWETQGLCSCAHWLNYRCGIGMNAAREKVRVAHALKKLPAISDAFRKGELSYSKVRAMTRVADENNEDYLMMIARHGTAHHVEKLVATYRRCKRLEDSTRAGQQYRSRELSVRYDEDGSLILNGRFPPEVGAMIVKALDEAMEQATETARRSDADITSEDESAGVSAETSETRERGSFAARRADALAEMAETYLSTGPASSTAADRYQVLVHVSAETLKGDHDVSAETSAHINTDLSHLDDGPRVSAETSRRIACDCSLVRLVEDDDGEPLSIGRKSRSIPSALRRAVKARDKACRFPGCTRRYRIDGHHIEHWADGGETSLKNLVQLCRHHHVLVHEGGFGCERGEDGAIVFTNPRGAAIPQSVEPMSLGDEADLVRWMDARLFGLEIDLDIDEDTCVPQWTAGDDMDWDLAVAHLFACERA